MQHSDWSDVKKVVAGENFCAILSWDGSITDTRSKDEDDICRDGSPSFSPRHVLVRGWTPPTDQIIMLAAGGGAGGELSLLGAHMLLELKCNLGFVAVAASGVKKGGHVLAVSSSGKIWAWGSNSHGQLGLGISDEYIYEPEVCSLDSSETIMGAACGKYHSSIWSSDGALYTCGDNSQGACGHKDFDAKVHLYCRWDHFSVVQAVVSCTYLK